MVIEQVKEALYEVTSMFFSGATVIWSEQTNTKPALPYVTLKIGAIQRTSFPIELEDGSKHYPCSTIVEINIYTRGKPVTSDKDVTGNFINTATSDMLDFFNFIESDEITDFLADRGIEFTLIPPVRDLTEIQNDRKYRYRSMAEATVTFNLEADGRYGISSMIEVPNSSGGGSDEYTAAETVEIENIEIQGGNSDDEE